MRLYTLLILSSSAAYLAICWSRTRNFNRLQAENEKGLLNQAELRSFSIVVPARNEADNLAASLHSLERIEYPAHLYEVILVDDASSDSTLSIMKGWQLGKLNVHVLSSKRNGGGKKAAIEFAIDHSTKEFIVTTDGDTYAHPKEWLYFINQALGELGVAAVGAVRLEGESIFAKMQALEGAGLAVLGAGSARGGLTYNAYGANFCYSRAAFHAVDGFQDLQSTASGDDDQLLMKLKNRYPSGIVYLTGSNSFVSTDAETSLSGFWQQRLRWAGKHSGYSSTRLRMMILCVGLHNVLCLMLIIQAITSREKYVVFKYLEIVLIAKVGGELPLLYAGAKWQGRKSLLLYYPVALLPQLIYSVAVGVGAQLMKSKWKGR